MKPSAEPEQRKCIVCLKPANPKAETCGSKRCKTTLKKCREGWDQIDHQCSEYRADIDYYGSYRP